MQVDRDTIKEILVALKAAYLNVRGKGGLGREEPDGITVEKEITEFLDDELEAAFRVLAKKELAEALGIEGWVRAEEE